MEWKRGLRAICITLPALMIAGVIWHASTTLRQAGLDQKLIHAIQRNDFPGVRRALQQGASVQARDVSGMPSVWQQILNIIRHRAAIGRGNTKPTSALALATEVQSVRIAKLLLQHGADPNQLDRAGTPLLMDAVGLENQTLGLELLRHGAYPNVANADGDTALMWAGGANHLVLVNLLLARGGKPDAQNRNGQTPLMWAIGPQDGNSLFLTSSNVAPHLSTSGTPRDDIKAHELELQHNQAIVATLLASGANVNLKDREGNSALAYAALQRPWLLTSFLAHQGDANARIASGHLDFKQQSSNGSVEWSIDFDPTNHRTLLMQAAITQDETLVRQLLAHHANVAARDSAGKTAYQLAFTPQIKTLLRKADATK